MTTDHGIDGADHPSDRRGRLAAFTVVTSMVALLLLQALAGGQSARFGGDTPGGQVPSVILSLVRSV